MAVASMRELLEAGVHFGHQTRRWNPKMRRYIYAERGGIYIIDLTQTQELLQEAYDFARNIAERNGTVLFVGTKKQAQDAISREAGRSGMPYVNHRWLGGLLTNWRTMSNRIERLHELRRLKSDGQLELLPSKERMAMLAELEKLEQNLGGVADLRRQPDAAFIVDLRKEALAVKEARRLGMPVIALVDTNADPDEAEYVIPGNDDAIRACDLITRVIADGVLAGKQRVSAGELGAGRRERRAEAAADEAAPAEAPTPEAQTPEAPTPEAQTPAAQTPEAQTPEATAEEAPAEPEVPARGVEPDSPPEPGLPESALPEPGPLGAGETAAAPAAGTTEADGDAPAEAAKEPSAQAAPATTESEEEGQ